MPPPVPGSIFFSCRGTQAGSLCYGKTQAGSLCYGKTSSRLPPLHCVEPLGQLDRPMNALIGVDVVELREPPELLDPQRLEPTADHVRVHLVRHVIDRIRIFDAL